MHTPYSSNVLRGTSNVMGIPHITPDMKLTDLVQSTLFDKKQEIWYTKYKEGSLLDWSHLA